MYKIYGFDYDELPDPLPLDEEAYLLAELAKGNSDAKDKLILHSLRLVIFVAKQFEINYKHEIKDLVSEGALCLISAIDKFKPGTKATLASYIRFCVKNRMVDYIRKVSNHQHVSSLDDEAEEENRVYGKRTKISLATEDHQSGSMRYTSIPRFEDQYFAERVIEDMRETLSPGDFAIFMNMLVPRDEKISQEDLKAMLGINNNSAISNRGRNIKKLLFQRYGNGFQPPESIQETESGDIVYTQEHFDTIMKSMYSSLSEQDIQIFLCKISHDSKAALAQLASQVDRSPKTLDARASTITSPLRKHYGFGIINFLRDCYSQQNMTQEASW